MVDFPTSIFSPRTVENRPGVVYDSDKTKVFFAEDLNKATAEIVALEEALGVNKSNMALDGWIPAGETWTYVSASTFTISGDKTDKYQKGDKIKLTNSSLKYFYIISVSYSSPNTTITITGGSDYSLVSGAITSPYYSKQENPQGFPDVFNYTPTFTGNGSLTYTSVTAMAKFKIVGRVCHIFIESNGTMGGTTDTYVWVNTPVTSTAAYGAGCYLYDSGVKIGIAEFRTNGILRFHHPTTWGLGANKFIRFSGACHF